jgi:hypothetical protein
VKSKKKKRSSKFFRKNKDNLAKISDVEQKKRFSYFLGKIMVFKIIFQKNSIKIWNGK